MGRRLSPAVQFVPVTVNAAAGFRFIDPAGQQDAAIAIDVSSGLVSAIWVVSNPDKLTHMDSPAVIN